MSSPAPAIAATSAAAPPAHGERRLFAIGLRLVAVAVLAVMFASVKLASERGVNVVESLFYRQLVAIPLVVGWIAATQGLGSIRTRNYGGHVTRTAVGLFGMILNFGAVILLPLAEATAIGFSAPIFGTLLGALILKEATGIHRWAAVLVGFGGILFMVRPDAAHFSVAGVVVALAAAFMTAVISILIRQLSRTEASSTIVFWFTLFSMVPLGFGMIRYGQAHDPVTWGLIGLIGISGGAAQLLLTGSVKWAPISLLMPLDYSNLIWATLLGAFIWHKLPEQSTWAGSVLIVGSGLYIVWRERQRNRNAPAPAEVFIDD